ncbi:MAG TPA: glucosyl-3-phosphoglycerate synthase [Streptosporangiaceae bacterium]|nr:glucosyl-3-phosphoglycerate synthase [Streptosporangiaceae bacterium]
MLPEVRAWLRDATTAAADWPVPALVAAKGTARISVVLPAYNEGRTVGTIVAAIRGSLMQAYPLVDEIVVIDSRSTDDTARVAAAAGARVFAQDGVLPHLRPESGKGEALWKSLAVTTGDLIVFLDADVSNFSPAFVTGLLGPLLADPDISFVKASYDRPVAEAAGIGDTGGRVTELVARPLLNLHWPLLAGFVQPLSGEYASRRSVLERVPFCTGYGVEFGLLVDLLEAHGLAAMAQVDLGTRAHKHQGTAALGRMSGQIMLTAWSRLQRHGMIVAGEEPSALLAQFRRDTGGHRAEVRDVSVAQRPPMIEIPEYPAGRMLAADA